MSVPTDKKIIKLVIITVIIGLIISFTIAFLLGVEKIVQVLSTINLKFFSIACAFQALYVSMLVLRWKKIINAGEINISTAKLFLITLSGIAFSGITPASGMGGEPVKAYFLSKYAKIKKSEAIATIFMERILDSVAFSIVSVLVIAFVLFNWNLPIWVVGILIFSLIFCVSIILIVTYISINKHSGTKSILWIFRKLAKLVKKIKPSWDVEKKFLGIISVYQTKVKQLIKNKQIWLYGSAYSFLIIFFNISRAFYVFLALGITGDPLSLWVIIAVVLIIASLVGTIPFPSGGLGLMEFAMITVYSVSGITLITAGMQTLVDRLISFWFLIFVGLLSTYVLKVYLQK